MDAIPKYPYMFSKPLSCLKSQDDPNNYYIGRANGPTDIVYEVELGVMFGQDI